MYTLEYKITTMASTHTYTHVTVTCAHTGTQIDTTRTYVHTHTHQMHNQQRGAHAPSSCATDGQSSLFTTMTSCFTPSVLASCACSRVCPPRSKPVSNSPCGMHVACARACVYACARSAQTHIAVATSAQAHRRHGTGGHGKPAM